jgi:hypothetical protein
MLVLGLIRHNYYKKKQFFFDFSFVKTKNKYTFAHRFTRTQNESVLTERKMGVYQSGQMGQTVTLLEYSFGGSNPSAPTN